MTANVLLHKTNRWSNVLHHWQVRLVTEFTLNPVQKVALDPRFPNLALVMTEAPLDDENIEHAFRNSPEEMDHLVVHIFPDVPGDMSESEIFELAAEELGIRTSEVRTT